MIEPLIAQFSSRGMPALATEQALADLESARAEKKRAFDSWRVRGRPALQQLAEQVTQRPEPAQYGGGERARQRPIAVRQRRKPRRPVPG